MVLSHVLKDQSVTFSCGGGSGGGERERPKGFVLNFNSLSLSNLFHLVGVYTSATIVW